jgi:aspartyl-tRNA(Asn)/glutamyl-tRNA(Gln) amidotransferase subunit A
MTIDTLRLTAEEAVRLLALKELTPAELRRAYLDAIATQDPELHCYLHVLESDTGEGVPIAVKDVISTRGIPTTAGSRILEDYRPPYDATVISRLRAHGLSLLGKTNTDEFAMGSTTESSAFGPTRNPWDPTRIPGGSGGGSAAAVSAGLAPWALGTDTGGSIKQPASMCGIVGLRPTYGSVSRYGVIAYASSLDQVGPVAKTVRDCALLYSLIAGHDPKDATTIAQAATMLPEREDLRGVKVGVPVDMLEVPGLDPAVRLAITQAIALAVELGAEVEECRLPLSTEYGLACYYLIAPAEASSNLARYDGVRFGKRSEADNLTELYENSRAAGFGAEVKRRIMVGTYALSAGYYDAYYGQAQKVRGLIIAEHRELFQRYDVLLAPTAPRSAWRLGELTDPLELYASDVLTLPSCLAGLPGLVIPCGLAGGLPVGLQLLGAPGSENALFAAGHALEHALAFDGVPTPLREETR